MGRLTNIWRHPIKAHGCEAVTATEVAAQKTLPGDRIWAVAHEAAQLKPGWNPCANFSRGAKAPALMALTSAWDPETDAVTLRHPDRPDLTFNPDADAAQFLEWIAPLMPQDRAASTAIVRAGDVGLTDSPFPSIALLNASSNRAVGQAVGKDLSQRRWRGNLWVDGLGPWEEFEWIGRDLRIGTATFHAAERITRCRATMVDPETGKIDADTLGALNDRWGHQDFGIYLTCTQSGRIATGDTVTLLP